MKSQRKAADDLNRRKFISTITQSAAILAFGLKTGSRAAADEPPPQRTALPSPGVLIGNFLDRAPSGIAWVVNSNAAFILDTGKPYVAGTAAADSSYHAYRFEHDGTHILFKWGRIGDNVVGRFSADRETDIELTFSSGWPGWTSAFTMTQDGANGVAQSTAGQIEWTLRISPAPKLISSSTVTVKVTPYVPVRFVAGLNSNSLPAFESVDDILDKAYDRYEATRPKARGDFYDFIGAITDNMNNSRIYSNDNNMLAHSVCRDWSNHPNGSPYFCWDSFFNANLAAINDPVVAQNTVRAILSYQSSEGLVPNYAHWDGGVSNDRSQPPVASLCAWKMHQRYLNDEDFLAEIYPQLVKWHDWWPQYRNNKEDGLLEWGSSIGDFQGAQFETGWDDNLHYEGVEMKGTTMEAYSIDLCSLWSMDAHYLALIADLLGHKQDAARFLRERATMNQRVNDRLWNSSMNCYCSKYWDDAGPPPQLDPSVFGPGFECQFYSDPNLQTPVASRHDQSLNFDWNGSPPFAGVPATRWSARWKGTLTPSQTGVYKVTATADDGVRVFVDGKLVIDDWTIHPPRKNTGTIRLSQGQSVAIVVEYFQWEGGSQLEVLFSMSGAPPSHQGEFLKRLTPMNFYPLAAGVPDKNRAQHVLQLLMDPNKFWGRYLLPTLAYDDPDYLAQEYWRGDVWGPPNYIVWQGLKKYASPAQMTEFAERNVELFMTNWIAKGVCGENYLSTDGSQAHDPHYTWGALLCLIGLENIVDVDDSGHIILNGAQTRNIMLQNIPLLGRRYDVKTAPGSATLIQNGKAILTAKATIVQAAI